MGIGSYIGPTPVHIEPKLMNATGMELGLPAMELQGERYRDIARGVSADCVLRNKYGILTSLATVGFQVKAK